jgi:hypothetical protein
MSYLPEHGMRHTVMEERGWLFLPKYITLKTMGVSSKVA